MVETREESGKIEVGFILKVSTVLHFPILNGIFFSLLLKEELQGNYLERLYYSPIILGHIELVLNWQL